MSEMFEAIFESDPDPAGIVLDGRYVAVNVAFETMMQWRREEVIGRHVLELNIYSHVEQRIAMLAELVATGAFDGFIEVTRKDGVSVAIRASVRVIELNGKQHVYWRSRAIVDEETLAIGEARLRALNAAAFEGIAITHGGHVADCNRQLASMIGYEPEELVGLEVSQFVAPESRESVRIAIETDNEGPYEHLALRKDGTTFPVEVRARTVSHRGITFRVTAIRDLSDHKHTLAELGRVIAELRVRNTEMEQFVYTVSHDLKTPLVTIRGFLGSIIADLEANRLEHVASDLARIGNAAGRMTELLEDLVELSRVGRVCAASSRVELAAIARDAVELAQGSLGGVVVAIGALPVIVADRGRMLQVFQNLVENAVKYMGPQPAPRIEIGIRDGRAGMVTVFVRDNGKGIEPMYLERIFGLFEKLDPRSRGTGLGLALVRRILEFHGGRVWAESSGPGAGSSFVFELPLDRPPTA